MSLKCGIVGLPNVGKSTLYNALTKADIPAENYPFCTIEPNSGIVSLPDKRLDKLKSIYKPLKTIPNTSKSISTPPPQPLNYVPKLSPNIVQKYLQTYPQTYLKHPRSLNNVKFFSPGVCRKTYTKLIKQLRT